MDERHVEDHHELKKCCSILLPVAPLLIETGQTLDNNVG